MAVAAGIAADAKNLEFSKRYSGVITHFYEDRQYGFIKSEEVSTDFGNNAFLSGKERGEFGVGSTVNFSIAISNKWGQPQARLLEATEGAAPTVVKVAEDGFMKVIDPAREAQRVLRDKEYIGIISAFYPDRGFGFVKCDEVTADYQMDAFVSKMNIGEYRPGARVKFRVRVGTKSAAGKPSAWDVSAVETPEQVAAAIASSRGLEHSNALLRDHRPEISTQVAAALENNKGLEHCNALAQPVSSSGFSERAAPGTRSRSPRRRSGWDREVFIKECEAMAAMGDPALAPPAPTEQQPPPPALPADAPPPLPDSFPAQFLPPARVETPTPAPLMDSIGFDWRQFTLAPPQQTDTPLAASVPNPEVAPADANMPGFDWRQFTNTPLAAPAAPVHNPEVALQSAVEQAFASLRTQIPHDPSAQQNQYAEVAMKCASSFFSAARQNQPPAAAPAFSPAAAQSSGYGRAQSSDDAIAAALAAASSRPAPQAQSSDDAIAAALAAASSTPAPQPHWGRVQQWGRPGMFSPHHLANSGQMNAESVTDLLASLRSTT